MSYFLDVQLRAYKFINLLWLLIYEVLMYRYSTVFRHIYHSLILNTSCTSLLFWSSFFLYYWKLILHKYGNWRVVLNFFSFISTSCTILFIEYDPLPLCQKLPMLYKIPLSAANLSKSNREKVLQETSLLLQWLFHF